MTALQHNIVCFGEVLWDVYPDGKKLGGAPFNVAAHLTQLGTHGHIITKVGTDANGTEILEAIKSQQIRTDYTQLDHTFETGLVNVSLDEEGKPSYDIRRPSAWDFIHTNLKNLSLVEASDGLIFGSLACRSGRNRKTLKDLAAISRLNVCDLNLRQKYFSKEVVEELLHLCHILKINNEEADILCNVLSVNPKLIYPFLIEHYQIEMIVQTNGPDGAEAYRKDEHYTAPSAKIEVVDTVGSGDAFLAAFVHHYLQESPIDVCLAEGCKLGAYVATKSGAIPEHPSTNIEKSKLKA